MISTNQADVNASWEKTFAALKEIGPETDEAKSHDSREWRTEHVTLQHKENLVVLEIEATDRNSMMVDDSDTTTAKRRMNEAILFVEKINDLKMDTRKAEAP